MIRPIAVVSRRSARTVRALLLVRFLGMYYDYYEVVELCPRGSLTARRRRNAKIDRASRHIQGRSERALVYPCMWMRSIDLCIRR